MKSIDIAASGMVAQNARLKVIAQNIANADSVASEPGGVPYQRKTITFKSYMDKTLGVETVEINKVGVDNSAFPKKYEPSHPAADADGYVLRPNVSTLIEMTDMREAKAAYQANISVIEISKMMISRTVDLLRN